MEFTKTKLPGVMLIQPDVFRDARGFFIETYHADKYKAGGIPETFVQDNLSRSIRGTLRGMHAQRKSPQGKLIHVIEGEIFDVAVDIRRDSPTFCQWVGFKLSADKFQQCYVPAGFAHGFFVLSAWADVLYKCTEVYQPGDEYGVNWADERIGIDWPMSNPILSAKDAGLPMMAGIPVEDLPI